MSSLSGTITITTAVAAVFVIIAQMPVAFGVVFMMFLLSQGLLIWMVMRILKDKRTSEKTFDTHFYEDVD